MKIKQSRSYIDVRSTAADPQSCVSIWWSWYVGGVGVLVDLVCCRMDGLIFLVMLKVFFESGCPAGSHVEPSGCLSGGLWPSSGSDLALLGSQGGSMGTPRGHYVGHLAPQGVALGHQRGHIWHHGGAMVATCSQDTSLEGPKQ